MLNRFLATSNHLPVDIAFDLGHANSVDLRTIEEIDTHEAEEIRVRENMIRYISERE